jgi:hypothetical protein
MVGKTDLFPGGDPQRFAVIPSERLVLFWSVVADEELAVVLLIPHVVVNHPVNLGVQT